MKTIIWAVDPLLSFSPTAGSAPLGPRGVRAKHRSSVMRFPEEVSPLEQFQHLASWALHRFVTRLTEPVRILPLTAWTSDPYRPADGVSPVPGGSPPGRSSLTSLASLPPAHWLRLQEDLRNLFAETTERVRIPGLEPLEVIENPSFPLRLRTELFYERCLELHADLIFMASRGQDRLRRCLGGSFSENLVSLSAVPCLIMNSDWNRLTDHQSFHYATGFSETSLMALESLLPWLRSLRAKIRLLHFQTILKPDLSPLDPQEAGERFSQLARVHRVPLEMELRAEPLHELVPVLLRESEETGGFLGLDVPAASLRRILRGNPVKRLVRGSRAPLFCVSGDRVLARAPRKSEPSLAPSAA